MSTKPTLTPLLTARFAEYHAAPGNGAWGSLHMSRTQRLKAGRIT